MAAARRALRRASDRANQAATWAWLTFIGLLLAMVACYRVSQRAEEIQGHVLEVARLLQRQTEILLERVPADAARTPQPAPLDLPAAIAEGA